MPKNTIGGDMNAILGQGSEFEGKLSFQGTVRIDGKFKGEVLSDDVLVVGESAEVRAEISVGTVIINGKVWGDVRAKESVQIHAPAQLRGNIFTPSLTIDEGVVFEGKCQMENLGELITRGEQVLEPVVPPEAMDDK
ncbi:MAG: polymer-forming cytoskeletal protein [Deltaproteobacteria bacterium]|nr:polymer-forming cytoskeletal protein [Deltaproteobacteria bacterium]